MNSKKVEICAYSVQSAMNAQTGGAYRVELCSSPIEGGTTPSYSTIKIARENLSIKLHIIIRPRGGDFCYSPLEYETMKLDINMAKSLGADGIVFGILLPNGTIDRERTRELIDIARPMGVTFHRAFDMSKDPFDSLEKLIDVGAERILTSGQKKSAFEGKELVKKLIETSGEKIIIMPGGGINTNNITELAEFTGANEFHLSAKVSFLGQMEYKKENLSFIESPSYSDYEIIESDSSLIREVVTKLNSKSKKVNR